MEYESKKIFLINTLYIATVLLLVYIVSKFMLGYLLPFVFALIFSFLGTKLSKTLSKKTRINEKFMRICVLILFYLSFILILALLFFYFIRYSGKFLSELKNFFDSKDNIFYTVSKKINTAVTLLPENMKDAAEKALENFYRKFLSFITDTVSSATMSFAKFLPRFFISSTVTVVASFYITKDYDRLLKFLRNILGDKKYNTIIKIKSILFGSVLKLLLGYIILSSITFFVLLLVFLIFSFNNPIIFALITAFIDLLPVLGAGTVLVPAALLNFFIGKPATAIILFVLYISVTLLKNFLEPKIISDRLDVNPLLMLLTLFIGLKIGGITGMLLLPIWAVVTLSYYKTE